MNNEKFSDFSLFHSAPGRFVRKYLWFVTFVFVVSGVICGGLYLNAFGCVDRVNAYILADTIMCSMIRSTVAATALTMLIDSAGKRYREQ